jgi:lycopene beta-cyclase
MDFRIHQLHGTSFVYVLPLSPSRALIEYTLFTPQLLSPEQYDKELKDYTRDYLKLEAYKIIDEEFGIIPMTNARFPFYNEGVYHIGSAGGQTKASTGYTFHFIQKQARQIIDYLIKGHPLQSISPTPPRFRFYDSVLLQVLKSGHPGGDALFTRLFSRNDVQRIFRFLDNESSLSDDLAIIRSLPSWPFLKAAVRHFS